MKYGVLLTRAQPFHMGHLDVVQKALEENDRVLIVVGSANKAGTKRNPLSIEPRMELVSTVLYSYGMEKEVDVLPLSDWSAEDTYQYAKEWGNFFYYNVVNAIQEKTFTMYYNDSVDTVKNWFVPEIAERLTIKCAKRKRDVSGTKIREAIEKDDDEYLKEMLPSSVYKKKEIIKKILLNSTKEDYMMA
jgi:cytidyltransferase-like protein